MVITEPQTELQRLLCLKLGYKPTANFKCLGLTSADGKQVLGVVGYDYWNFTSCEMHVAGEQGFVTRDHLYRVFAYPFIVGGCQVVIGRVPSWNDEALRFDEHLGFKEMCRIPGAIPGGELVILAMQRDECRWLAYGDRKLERAA